MIDPITSYFVAEIIKALNEGELTKVVAYVAIFLVLWLQLRGLRKEMKQLNATITESFARGEKRFDSLEKKDLDFEHRITVLENKIKE